MAFRFSSKLLVHGFSIKLLIYGVEEFIGARLIVNPYHVFSSEVLLQKMQPRTSSMFRSRLCGSCASQVL